MWAKSSIGGYAKEKPVKMNFSEIIWTAASAGTRAVSASRKHEGVASFMTRAKIGFFYSLEATHILEKVCVKH